MASNLAVDLTDDGFNRMEPSLINAAEKGDINAAKEALARNPNCIFETDDYNLNALQVSLCEFHHDMAFFLLEETKISALHKDALGRDSIKIGIYSGNEALCEKIAERWNEEWYKEYQSEQNKVVPFNPAP